MLKQSSVRHDHLCPRQILGMRIGLAVLAAIGLEAPMPQKAALVFIESDGCFVDGIEVATRAAVGHRTLRVVVIGKTGAVFANVKIGNIVRIAPQLDIRSTSLMDCPKVKSKYYAQLKGYQAMPDAELLSFIEACLSPSLKGW
jgi:formylmethanofuran dehydrogenase subunit E